MDLAKDEIFNIRYEEGSYKKENKFLKLISKHKFIFSLSALGLAICAIDGILIYNFFKILVIY